MGVRQIGLAICAFGLFCCFTVIAFGENLHQKYRAAGNDRWNCSWITANDWRYEACKKCELKAMEFDDANGGSCVEMESSYDRAVARKKLLEKYGLDSDDRTPDRSSHIYGALAVKKFVKDGQEFIASAVGYANNSTDAQGLAKSGCNSLGASNCDIVGDFSHGGCGFVVLCRKDRALDFSVGKTVHEARSKCMGGNYEKASGKPVGGCTIRR